MDKRAGWKEGGRGGTERKKEWKEGGRGRIERRKEKESREIIERGRKRRNSEDKGEK